MNKIDQYDNKTQQSENQTYNLLGSVSCTVLGNVISEAYGTKLMPAYRLSWAVQPNFSVQYSILSLGVHPISLMKAPIQPS